MFWRIVDGLIPGALFLRDWSAEKWQKLVADGFVESIRKHAEAISAVDQPPLDLWEDALSDEHRRLGNVEQKARTALGATGLIIPLTVLIVGPQGTNPSTTPLIGGGVALVYLVWGFMLGLRANSISMRVYVNPEDYSAAVTALADAAPECQTMPIIRAATTLAARDHMAELNRFKVNAADASLRALRNGLLVLVATAFSVMLTR